GATATAAPSTTTAPIWRANLDRTGRRYASTLNIEAIHPRFATQTGFVRRVDLTTAGFNNRFTWYGKSGATVESYTFGVNLTSTWWYHDFLRLDEPLDPKLHFNNSFSFKGG